MLSILLTKNDLLLFGPEISSAVPRHVQKSNNYLRTNSVSERSRSDEEKKRVEREEKSGLSRTIQDYSLSLREACARRPSMRSRNIRQGEVRCWGLCFFSHCFFFSFTSLLPFPRLVSFGVLTPVSWDPNPFRDSGRNLSAIIGMKRDSMDLSHLSDRKLLLSYI